MARDSWSIGDAPVPGQNSNPEGIWNEFRNPNQTPSNPLPHTWTDPADALPPPPTTNKAGMEGIAQGFLTPFDEDVSQRTRELGKALEQFSNEFGTNLGRLKFDLDGSISDLAGSEKVYGALQAAGSPISNYRYNLPLPTSRGQGGYHHQRMDFDAPALPDAQQAGRTFGDFGLKRNGVQLRSFGELANFLVRGGYLTSGTLEAAQNFMRQNGGYR